MFSLSGKLKVIEKLAIDNSPVLLTAIGVAGTIGTAILTHRSATRAEIWRRNEIDSRDAEAYARKVEPIEITKREHFDATWKFYIAPVSSGVVTVGCIVLANHIGTKRAAAIAAAYTISEKAYAEYREKVVERIGEKEETKVRDEIVRDRLERNPQREDNTVIIGSGDVLCYEMYTDRYFNSSVEAIKKARNEVNHMINVHGYASVSEFYHQLGLPNTSISDSVGWNSDKLMDIDFTTELSPDGRPCVAISFVTGPQPDHDRFH